MTGAPLPAQPAVDRAPAAVAPSPPSLATSVLVDVVTRLWRAQRQAQRLAEDAGASAGPASRAVARELDAALSALDGAGLVVQDHDGADFDAGLALIAVAFQPTAGLARERVLETLRPSVYLGETHLQRGEVVVGIPIPADGAEPETIAEQETR